MNNEKVLYCGRKSATRELLQNFRVPVVFGASNYTSHALQFPDSYPCRAPNYVLPVFVQALSGNGLSGFTVNFLMGGGASGAVSETAVATLECMKLLIQNKGELFKSGRLSEPYKGIGDCFKGTTKDEGFGAKMKKPS